LLQSQRNQNNGPDQDSKKNNRVGREILNGYPDEKVRDTPSQAGSKKEPKGFTGHDY
jgi:hypothetical protein